MQGVNSKCPRCGKTVYFAERRLYEGKYYHMQCSAAQQDEDLAGKKHFAIHEDIFCNPQDKRVAAPEPVNATNKVCPRCNTCVIDSAKFCTICGFKFEEKAAPSPAPPPSLTCSSCGQPHQETDRFCRSCGNKLIN